MFAPNGSRRGGVVLEFALAVPVVLAILAGLLDYGWYFLQRNTILNATRDAARLGVAVGVDTDPRPVAEDALRNILDDAGMPCAPGCAVAGRMHFSGGYLVLTLDTDWPYEPLVGLVPTPGAMAVSFNMMMEQQNPAWYGL